MLFEAILRVCAMAILQGAVLSEVPWSTPFCVFPFKNSSGCPSLLRFLTLVFDAVFDTKNSSPAGGLVVTKE